MIGTAVLEKTFCWIARFIQNRGQFDIAFGDLLIAEATAMVLQLR
jgi:hypothetical protein